MAAGIDLAIARSVLSRPRSDIFPVRTSHSVNKWYVYMQSIPLRLLVLWDHLDCTHIPLHILLFWDQSYQVSHL